MHAWRDGGCSNVTEFFARSADNFDSNSIMTSVDLATTHVVYTAKFYIS
jgi:hypothetical protein